MNLISVRGAFSRDDCSRLFPVRSALAPHPQTTTSEDDAGHGRQDRGRVRRAPRVVPRRRGGALLGHLVRTLRRDGSARAPTLVPVDRRGLRARRGRGGGRAHRALRRQRGALLHLPQGRRRAPGQARGRRRQGSREQDPAALRRRVVRGARGRRRRARRGNPAHERRGRRRSRREAPRAHHARPRRALHEGRPGRAAVRVQPQGGRGPQRHGRGVLDVRHPAGRGGAAGA